MKLNLKLLAAPFVILLSLFYISFIFSSEIDRLKKEIDNIYFGNFIPVHKLHIILEKYNEIIYDDLTIVYNKKTIEKNWRYYNSQYKTDKERKIVEKIDKLILKSFNNNSKDYYKFVITQINLLIEHEIYSASMQRKSFLEEYNKINRYLMYNQIFIFIFILIFITLIIINTIKNNKKQEYLIEKYKQDSITDGLTKLYNRKYFDTLFDDITNISSQNAWLSAFVMIDIDFFKQFNDTYGHDDGDTALKKVSKALNNTFQGEYEYTFRLGGEEFGVLMFDTNIQALQAKLDILQVNIKNLTIPHSASATNFLTISMGVVIINNESYTSSIKDLYKLADEKLYHSKENGRNQYTI
ncbi:MAG: GGDEF domain-containing protein [Campylobacterota bacterium]|nr:GGDEF domain-containing protein [Campylobacterota bacterium]